MIERIPQTKGQCTPVHIFLTRPTIAQMLVMSFQKECISSTKYQSSSSSMDYAWILVQKFRESLNIWVLLFWSFALYCLHCYLLMLFKCHFFQNLFFPFEIGHILFCLIRFHIICLYYLPFGLKMSSAVEIVDTYIDFQFDG